MSHAAPDYAPRGSALVAASALGVSENPLQDKAIREHLAWLYGLPTTRWDLIAS